MPSTRSSRPFAVAALLSALAAAPSAAESPEPQWPRWRGPLASGEAPSGSPPIAWSESRNVRWKVELPGRGHASPIVASDRIFLLTAVETQVSGAASADGGRGRVVPEAPLRFMVLALDRHTGQTIWMRTAREELPHEGGTHPDASFASASAVTDGERVYAFFGSRGLYAYTLDGDLEWSVDLGDMTTRRGFGEGSSPALAGDRLIVNWDHEGDSFIVALDKRTGRELWRRERDEVTSWATPLVVDHGGRRQVVVSATGKIRSYDVETGDTLWEEGGMTLNVIPTPIYRDGVVYATSGFRGSAFKALRLSDDGSNRVSVVWSYDQDTPYVPSPLLVGNRLYFVKLNTGILTVLDAATGEPVYGPERLPGVQGIYASPVAAAGRVYFFGRDGGAVVLQDGPRLEVLAENSLDDGFDASPALVGDEILVRGRRYLYCLSAAE